MDLEAALVEMARFKAERDALVASLEILLQECVQSQTFTESSNGAFDACLLAVEVLGTIAD